MHEKIIQNFIEEVKEAWKIRCIQTVYTMYLKA